MAQHIRQDPGIWGSPIPSGSREETKVLANMDDLKILCQSKWFMERALWLTQVYEVAAGAKLSMSKSTSYHG